MKTDHFWRFPPDTSIREHRERWRCPFPVFPGDAKNWERGNTNNITAVPGVPNVPAARRGPAAVAAGKVDCGSRLNLEEGPTRPESRRFSRGRSPPMTEPRHDRR